jgi:hypothetical protein
MSVFVSRQISAAKRKEAKEALLKFRSDAVFTDNDDTNNVLRVVSDLEIDMKQRLAIPTVAFGSLKYFAELGANPFKLKSDSKIKNLHLFGKFVAFTGITMPLLSELTRIVLKMGGNIAERYSRVDYRIIKPEKAFSNGIKYIKYEWLYALQQSPNFVDPKDYIFTDPSPSQSPLSQSISSNTKSQIPLLISPTCSKLLLVEASRVESSQLSQISKRSYSQRSIISSPEPGNHKLSPKIAPPKATGLSDPAKYPEIESTKEEANESELESDSDSDNFMFERVNDIKDIETFARTKICITPRLRENVCDNSKKDIKVIPLSSVLDFTQMDDDQDSEDEVYYSNERNKNEKSYSADTPFQDPLPQLSH